MLLVVKYHDLFTEYHVSCGTCERLVASYYVYVDNGLIDPQFEFDRISKYHSCVPNAIMCNERKSI